MDIPGDVLEEFFEQYFSNLTFEDQMQIVRELIKIMRVRLAQNRKK